MKLKTTIQIIILAIIPVFFTHSCSSQLDEIKPANSVAQNDIGSSDIVTLRNGMYSLLEDFSFDYWYDFDVRAVNFKGGPGFTISGDPVNMRPSDSDLYNRWSKSYITLNKINFLIKVIEGSPDSANFNTTKGEALYARALIYYYLVTRWGGVPILTSQTYEVIPRSTESQVWTQIKNDLLQAESLVAGPSNTSFYITKPAVWALQARVFLATGQKTDAVTYCDKILALNNYTISSDTDSFSAIWSAGGASKEIIFALANNNSSNPHLFYQSVNDIDGSWNYSATDQIFNNLYSNSPLAMGDKRKAAVFSSASTRIIKFPNGVNGQQLAPTSNANFTPIVISRISEIYLIKAEAQGGGSSSAATLTSYFAARYAVPPSQSVISALSPIEFQNMILDERQREFYGEGFRWYDIKRTGRTDLLTTLAGRTYLLYYPIPQLEIDLGGYTQNPGYN